MFHPQLEKQKDNIIRLIDREIIPIQHFTKGGVVLDVGANIGLWSAGLLLYGGDAIERLEMFEPLPGAREAIQRNIFETGLAESTRVNVNPFAVSSEVGTATISYDNAWSPLATLAASSVRLPRRDVALPHQIEVQTITIDQFCKDNNIDRISYMKLDVEGFEMEVLNGALNMLSNQRIDALCWEFGLPHIGRHTFRSFWNILSEHGYKIGLMRRGESGFDILPIDDYITHWEKFDVNRVFVAHL